MREILFKAKRRNWEELPKEQWWVEGNLILSNDAEDDFKAIIIPQIDSDMFTKNVGFKEVSCDLGFENWYKVDKDTICQFTGLTDKNGKRIWENDIVKCEGDYLGEKTTYTGMVFFREDTCSFLVSSGESIDYEWWCEQKEVIGNRFDNPEILEG